MANQTFSTAMTGLGVPQYIVNSILVGHEGLKLDNYQTDEHYLTVNCHLPCTIKLFYRTLVYHTPLLLVRLMILSSPNYDS